MYPQNAYHLATQVQAPSSTGSQSSGEDESLLGFNVNDIDEILALDDENPPVDQEYGNVRDSVMMPPPPTTGTSQPQNNIEPQSGRDRHGKTLFLSYQFT